jgi:hypothetical protein
VSDNVAFAVILVDGFLLLFRIGRIGFPGGPPQY